MSRPVLLNNIDHHALRVSTAQGTGLGDDVMSALTFAAEFRELQAYYPIVFQKDEQGSFHPLVLLGLQSGQNLFLRHGTWDAHYRPLAIERQPFLIGSNAGGAPMLHIDLDHPRVGPSGEALFLEHGGSTPFLQHVTSVLRTLHDGLAGNAAFVKNLLNLDLLEPFVLDLRLPDDAPARLTGYYTIAEERLRALDAATLHALARVGYLEPIYMAVASLSHFRDLIGRLEADRVVEP